MPVQVVVDENRDVVVADVPTAIRFAADAWFDLRGDPDGMRDLEAKAASDYAELTGTGYVAGVAYALRFAVRQQEGRKVEFVRHGDEPRVGSPTAVSTYVVGETADPYQCLMDALHSVGSFHVVAGMISIPDEMEGLETTLRQECASAVREACEGRTDREALAFLRSYQDDLAGGAPFAPYDGDDATEVLDALPDRVAAKFRRDAQDLMPTVVPGP